MGFASMPIVYRATSTFQITTTPTDPRFGVAHTGGWSESFWTLIDPLGPAEGAWTALRRARANLMPASASIVGFRVQKYNMTGNQLQAQGSTIGVSKIPGRDAIVTDLPQAAIALVLTTAGPNKANLILRAIPDDYIKGGEFAPDPPYLAFLTTFRNQIIANQYGFAGRDLSQVSARVLTISSEGVVTVDGIPSTGLVVNDFVRFNRVITAVGALVTGTFQVMAVAGNTFTVRPPWPGLVSKPGGTVRRDQMAFFPYTDTFLRRATTRKVGAPFEKYRGRRSKRRQRS